MSERLNLLFKAAPLAFLERVVFVTDTVGDQGAARQLWAKSVNFFDLHPDGPKAQLSVIDGLHLYSDAPLTGYFLAPGGSVTLPTTDGAHVFCFLRSFLNVTLYVVREGESLVRIFNQEQIEDGPVSAMVAAAGEELDRVHWKECVSTDVLSPIQANAVLWKPRGEPWTLIAQQLVGVKGREFVYRATARPLQT
jgi:hypothetical protein